MKKTLLAFALIAGSAYAQCCPMWKGKPKPEDLIHYDSGNLTNKPTCKDKLCRRAYKDATRAARDAYIDQLNAQFNPHPGGVSSPAVGGYVPIIQSHQPQFPTYNIQLFTDSNGYTWGQAYPVYNYYPSYGYYPVIAPYAPVVGPGVIR